MRCERASPSHDPSLRNFAACVCAAEYCMLQLPTLADLALSKYECSECKGQPGCESHTCRNLLDQVRSTAESNAQCNGIGCGCLPKCDCLVLHDASPPSPPPPPPPPPPPLCKPIPPEFVGAAMAQLKKYCVFYSPDAVSQGAESTSAHGSPTHAPPLAASPAPSPAGSVQESVTRTDRLVLLAMPPQYGYPIASPAASPTATPPTLAVPVPPPLVNASHELSHKSWCDAFMPTVENNALNQDGVPCYGSCKQASPVQAKELSQHWCQAFASEMLRQHSQLGAVCKAAYRGDFSDPCQPTEATDAAAVERLVNPTALGALAAAASGGYPAKDSSARMLDLAFSRLGVRGDGVLLPQPQVPVDFSAIPAPTAVGSATSPPALGQRFIEEASAANKPYLGSAWGSVRPYPQG